MLASSIQGIQVSMSGTTHDVCQYMYGTCGENTKLPTYKIISALA